ncbi:hypothetical protein V5F34_06135 [Xanthobacter autotrophicus]|jgi:hypothetical protein|uniref:Uncharacterized protein n=1 Tax=Xanthobacter autotrophicus TaxID=280 RepID=A0A6C1KSK5_XANAU|nr:hypothetical protein [Xanthobacter autotrophicus]TLX43256.1 hypothetical protein FBQ73_11560 [Xanthobacter autotrophicus]
MNALAKIDQSQSERQHDDVLIHVRFHPSAEIFTIDAKPDELSQRDWFNRLYMGVPQHYQTLANGRGFFRIPRMTFEALRSQGAA